MQIFREDGLFIRFDVVTHLTKFETVFIMLVRPVRIFNKIPFI